MEQADRVDAGMPEHTFLVTPDTAVLRNAKSSIVVNKVSGASDSSRSWITAGATKRQILSWV
jgi:hypothetical protein